MPLWSIVVTTYKRPEMLRETLGRILAAAPADAEILVSDDSPEREGQLATAPFIRDGRVRYRANRDRLGIVGNVNAAIRDSAGERIHWCADDDHPLPGFYRATGSGLSYGHVAHCQYRNLHTDGSTWSPRPHREKAGPLPREWATRLMAGNPHHMVATAFSRYMFDELGGFDDRLPHLHDWHFLIRAVAEFGAPWYTPEVLAEYRVHPGSATAQGSGVLQSERYQMFGLLVPFLDSL